MKISYLPGVVSPTGDTVFPTETAGLSKKVRLSTLNSFSGSGTISNVFEGQNVSLNPAPASTVSVINFSFPGAVFPFPSQNIPNGWLLCNGQAVSRQTYSTLFGVIGVAYGSGDNRTTFNLPDLRGRSVVGMETMGGVSSSGRLLNTISGNIDGNTLGAVGGEQAHSLTMSEAGVPPHQHTFTTNVGWSYASENGNRCQGGNSRTRGMFQGGEALNFAYSLNINSKSDSSSTAHPNLPPLVFLNWVIKY